MTARRLNAPLLVALLALIFTAVCAGSANASPVWKFAGSELMGEETIVGDATLSSLTFVGLSNTCKKMHYEMTISNSAGTGKAVLKALSFATCFTSSPECAIKTIGAEKLPWAAHLATVSSSPYIVLEGIKIAIFYAGELCALDGTLAVVTGTAGALYDNTSETFTFSAASFKATKTSLKALSSAVEWQGVFTTEATGAHHGQALTIS